MGNKCSRGADSKWKLDTELVALEFFDSSIAFPNPPFIEALEALTGLENMAEDDGTKVFQVQRDGTEFGMIWGYGLGRCHLMAFAHTYSPHIGVHLFVIDHKLNVGEYVSGSAHRILSRNLRPDIKALAVVWSSETADQRPTEEKLLEDTAGYFQDCQLDVEIIACRGDPKETMEQAMGTITGWVRELTLAKEKQKEEQRKLKESTIVYKLKVVAKSLPQKLTM